MEEFDLVVIGGGAAGERGAAQAAYFGKSVALIEKEQVHGGAMVNTGTLPSKTLRETALYLSGFRQRGLHGVDLKLSREASVDDFLYRLEAVVTEERVRISENLKRHGVRMFHGTARFTEPHTIAIDGSGSQPTLLRARHVLIATGSSPHRPPQFPFDHRQVYDSDEIVRVHDIPKSMVVVGGGVIGCEYACLFAALGTRVTIVEPKPTVLGFLDDDVVEVLKARMQALDIVFRMPAQVWGCEAVSGGVRLSLDSGDTLEAGCVLVCAGRQGNTTRLGLEHLGVEVNKRGHIPVDPVTFRTTAPHVAAVGDVVGFPALASTAMEQARVAVVHLFDLKYKTKVAPIFPYGIFTIPEVSMAGETERDLTAKGVDYVAGRADFAHNSRGVMVGDEGFLKLLFRRDDMTLLGVHCVGENATELVHIGLVSLMSKATADLFIETCFNYPTISEAYKYATYDALGRRARKG